MVEHRSRPAHLAPPVRSSRSSSVVPAFCVSFVLSAGFLVTALSGAFGDSGTTSVMAATPYGCPPPHLGCTYSHPALSLPLLCCLLIAAVVTGLVGLAAAQEAPALVAAVVGPGGWVVLLASTLAWRHGMAVSFSGMDFGRPECGLAGGICPYVYTWWPWWVDVGLAVALAVAVALGRWAWQQSPSASSLWRRATSRARNELRRAVALTKASPRLLLLAAVLAAAGAAATSWFFGVCPSIGASPAAVRRSSCRLISVMGRSARLLSKKAASSAAMRAKPISQDAFLKPGS